MKNSNYKIKLMSILIAMTISLSAAYSQSNSKQTTGVLNIETKGVIADAESVGNMVRLELEKTKVYVVLDRYDIADVLKKNNIDFSTCVAKTCLLQAGR